MRGTNQAPVPMAKQREASAAAQVQRFRNMAQQLRVDSISASTAAGSEHSTSSLSAADLMAVLMAGYLRCDFSHPGHPNDHLIFSKGHASPLLYAMFKAAGLVSDRELQTFRKFGSPLQGHPTPVLPWVDVATGSLGQGLPIGVGMALAGKYLDKRDVELQSDAREWTIVKANGVGHRSRIGV